MADPKVTLGDDEFHFSEAEEASGDAYTLTDEDVAGSNASKFNRRNILIAIVIIVIALSLYKLIGVFFGASDVKKTPAVAATPVAAPTQSDTANNNQAALSTITPQPAIPPTAQISDQPVRTEQVQRQLSQMQETEADHTRQIQQVSNQLSSLSESVQSLDQSMQSMNQALRDVSAQLQSQQMSIASMKVKRQPKIVRRATQPVYQAPKWYVRAIIPGRAWLEQTNGRTVTVNVGDILRGYGRVNAISVITGTVKLSSGAILTYKGS